ncbi:MAG: hypothetical protein H6714_06255 [Myxococcales bacterium]|nr:hypothetical protein [Myxococcales bacterium]
MRYWPSASKLMLVFLLCIPGIGGCSPAAGSTHNRDGSGQVFHRSQELVEKWIVQNTFFYPQFITPEGQAILENSDASDEDVRAALFDLVSRKSGKIALGIPLIVDADPGESKLEDFETRDIAEVLQALVPMKNAGLLDQIIVVTDRHGAAFSAARDVAENEVTFVEDPELATAEPNEKMGSALYAAIETAQRNNAAIFAWIDPELGESTDDVYMRRYVYGILGSLLFHQDIDFVKGYYEQSVDKGAGVPTGGGRVTELAIRPLLNILYPELAGFIHPLCSELAVRLDSLPTNLFQLGDGVQKYGATVGLMIDAFMHSQDLDRLAQVDLQYRTASNPDLPSLSALAIGEVDSILLRATRDRRLGFGSWPESLGISSPPPNRAMLRLRPKDQFQIDPNAPTYAVNKEFETIPKDRTHVMTDRLNREGWVMNANGTDPNQRVHTFSHWDFLEPDTRQVLKQMPPEELNTRFNRGFDSELIRDAIAPLLARKNALGITISVGLPALNEGNTIEQVIRSIQPLQTAGLVDEIVLIDSNSVPLKKRDELSQEEADQLREADGTVAVDKDGEYVGYVSRSGTREKAEKLGVPWYIHQSIHPELGSRKGKGETLWKSLAVLKGDIIVWIDTDIRNPSPRFVYGVLGPLLFNSDIAYVKGFYERPISLAGGPIAPSGGGRVTELTARPLLNYLYPELSGIIQPLSGEFAGRRDALMSASYYAGYGVETGLLIDIVSQYGMNSLAQVDLEVREHKNQDLPSLSKMAFGISDVIFQRAKEQGRIFFPMEPNRAMWRLKPRVDSSKPPDPNLPYISYTPFLLINGVPPNHLDRLPANYVEVIGPDIRRDPMNQTTMQPVVTTSGVPLKEWTLDLKRGKSIPRAPSNGVVRGIIASSEGDNVAVFDLERPRIVLTTKSQVTQTGDRSYTNVVSLSAACPSWDPTPAGNISSWQRSWMASQHGSSMPFFADFGAYALVGTRPGVKLVSRACVLEVGSVASQ